MRMNWRQHADDNRTPGWLLLTTAGFSVLPIALIRTGRAALFA
jgi:hypothetical protein